MELLEGDGFGEATLPDGDEGLPVVVVRGFEGGKIVGSTHISLRRQLQTGQVEAAHYFE